MFINPEIIPLLEPNRPEYPGRVFNKAQIVKDADKFFLYIPGGAEKVDEIAPCRLIKLYGQRIDGKIPPVQIKFY